VVKLKKLRKTGAYIQKYRKLKFYKYLLTRKPAQSELLPFPADKNIFSDESENRIMRKLKVR